MTNTKQTESILLNLPSGMLKKIDAIAEKERRTRTAQLILMLENELRVVK
jgi:hypothetical protein